MLKRKSFRRYVGKQDSTEVVHKNRSASERKGYHCEMKRDGASTYTQVKLLLLIKEAVKDTEITLFYQTTRW